VIISFLKWWLCNPILCGICSVVWQSVEGGEWSEHELALLAKAVARYPGGVTDRWEKISQMVGRSVKEVCRSLWFTAVVAKLKQVSRFWITLYTVSQKNGPTLKRYSSKCYGYILMIFGRNIQKALE